MAGTATEQCVGCGKPVVTLVGQGPQFNQAFAQAQENMLGSDSVKLSRTVEEVRCNLQAVLMDEGQIERARVNGRERMGGPGASRAIAEKVLSSLGLK